MSSRLTDLQLELPVGVPRVDPDAPRHPQQLVQVGPWRALIDVEIAPLIASLWRAGIATRMSCQDMSGFVWINFHDEHAMESFLRLAGQPRPIPRHAKPPLDAAATDGGWRVHERSSDERFGPSLLFPRADLAHIMTRMKRS